jgi:hypothetical protein
MVSRVAGLSIVLSLGCGPTLVDDEEPEHAGGATSSTGAGDPDASVTGDVGTGTTGAPSPGTDTADATQTGSDPKLDVGTPSPLYGPCRTADDCEAGLECGLILYSPELAWSMCTVPCTDADECPRPPELLQPRCEHDPTLENFYCVLGCDDGAPCPEPTACVEDEFAGPACVPQ